MTKFEEQPLPTEIRTEVPKNPESQKQEQGKQITIQSIVSYKKEINSTLSSESKAVQGIFALIERKTTEIRELPKEREIGSPEEAVDRVNADIPKAGYPAFKDVHAFLSISGLEVQNIESWQTINRGEIDSLASKRKELEAKNKELLRRLEEEKHKNPLSKMFHRKERARISTQAKEISDEISRIDALALERQSRGEKIEISLQEFYKKQRELAINAAHELFQDTLKRHEQLKERLTSPDVKRALNEDLIAKKVLPRLDKLKKEGKITEEDAREYIELLKVRLAEGSQADPSASEEKEEAEKRRRRLEQLHEKSQYSLLDIGKDISDDGNEVADNYYDSIFDFLIREVTRHQIEQMNASISSALSPGLQAEVSKIAERVISPKYNPEEAGGDLDLNKLPISDFDQLDGLERWQIVKNFAESSGLISKETFTQVERIIIQRLFNEQITPGGNESWDGSKAVGKIGNLANPEALPLMLRHIETSGPGHTNHAMVFIMERLLEESNPGELQQVLGSLPADERALLEIMAGENSYMKRFGRAADSRYFVCSLLQNGALTIAKEQLTGILEEVGKVDEKGLRDFYLWQTLDTPETLALFLKARAKVEKVIIDSKSGAWTQSADKLLAALVNPNNGESIAFPKRIIEEGLGISDPKIIEILNKIFEDKAFSGSSFEKEAFLDGLVLLNSKENGRNALETLLYAHRGTRKDIARMRRIFQLLSTLDGFGEYDLATPDYDEADKINQEINDLQSQDSQSQDKVERKKIKDRIEALRIDLQNLTGLKGIEDVMTQKVIETACRKLELPQEYKAKIEAKLEELMKNGIFEIVPLLAGRYEYMKETEVKKLLQTITAHIIDGDFGAWRYTHEGSEAQLAGLTHEQREFWKGTTEPIVIDINLPEDEKNRRADELKAAQQIIRNSKEHILHAHPDFDFSEKRLHDLNSKIAELTKMIKSAGSEDDKKRLIVEKRMIQAEAILINGILEIENATPQSFTREKVIAQAKELSGKIVEFNLPAARLDIEQIAKIFTVGDIDCVRAYESDEAVTLFKAGVEPQETCQSWRNGTLNECLLAYVADSNKKVINVTDGKGRIVARSIIKLTNQRIKGDSMPETPRKTILVENPYSLLPNSEVYRAFIRALLIKAQGLDASITFGDNFDDDTLQVFKEEARVVGYDMRKCDLDIFIPPSLNKYEYSDALGGKIDYDFGKYKSLEAITLERSEV
jgi:hypothetical protein